MKKTKKYKAPENWYGGRAPDGDFNDFTDYYNSWKKFNSSIEKITGLTVTGFDPGLNLADIQGDKYGGTVQLPLWFAKILVNKYKKLRTKKLQNDTRKRT